MTVEIIFLGTSAGLPTINRGLSAVAVKYEGETLLFDCGEGTQRQMARAKLGFGQRMKIFITHLHGDHVLGLPGLLQTMSLLDRKEKVDLFGPRGLGKLLVEIGKLVGFGLQFPLNIIEVRNGLVLRERKFSVRARLMDHTIPNYAYSFEEREKPGRFHPARANELGVPKGPLWHRLQFGKSVRLPSGRVVKPEEVLDSPRPSLKLVYSGDTRPCAIMSKFAHKANLLIHECTFDDNLGPRARDDRHSTPAAIAAIAVKAGVKKLILTHISARYQRTSTIRKQAQRIFPNTIMAYDLLKVNL